MKSFSRKRSNAEIAQLKMRFESGEKIGITTVIEEINPKSLVELFIIRQKVTDWFMNIRQFYRDRGRFFGRLNDEGSYGFPTTEAEIRYLHTRIYKNYKGHALSGKSIIENGKNEGKIPEGEDEDMTFPKPEEEEKKEEEKPKKKKSSQK